MKGMELFAKMLEVVVKGYAGAAVEHVVPVALGIEAIEKETAEKAVLGILDERAHLLGRAC